METSVPQRVLARIISCDTRYVGHKADEVVVLRDEDGEVEMTHEEYVELHDIAPQEVLFATMDQFMADIKGTNIVPTGDVIDVMLDLRAVLGTLVDEMNKVQKIMLEMLLEGKQ